VYVNPHPVVMPSAQCMSDVGRQTLAATCVCIPLAPGRTPPAESPTRGAVVPTAAAEPSRMHHHGLLPSLPPPVHPHPHTSCQRLGGWLDGLLVGGRKNQARGARVQSHPPEPKCSQRGWELTDCVPGKLTVHGHMHRQGVRT